MKPTDFELVISAVNAKPGMTGREVANFLKRQGHNQFTSSLANQILYRLLSASLVDRDSSGDKPKWSPSGTWSPTDSRPTDRTTAKRPLTISDRKVKNYLVASTDVKVLLDREMSSNDPYISTDWVGTHVVASVNLQHPFWTLRLDGPKDEALYCMFVAVDAYVQWKVAQLHEPPEAQEVQRMRDYALRYCTLEESELPTSDQRSDASRSL